MRTCLTKVSKNLKKYSQLTKPLHDDNFFKAFASCTAFGLAMGMGASAGFSAVTIPQLQINKNETIGNSDEEQSFYLTDKQISWFGKDNHSNFKMTLLKIFQEFKRRFLLRPSSY